MTEKSALTAEAERLLERMKVVPPREPGEQLRPADEARILELAANGITQTEIAKQVGCHQSTVSRTLADYDDSRPLARKYLEARALEMTRRLVTNARPETILRVLGKLDVVRDDSQEAAASHARIMIGMTLPDTGFQFQPDDVIVVQHDPIPEGKPSLMVDRPSGDGCGLLYPLPCPVSEIPLATKCTPDAQALIRDGVIVGENGSGAP